jgi:hypothetical protein
MCKRSNYSRSKKNTFKKTSTSLTTSAKLLSTAIAINLSNLKTKAIKLYILYQTDIWKNKTSRIFFGIFDCRYKALDSAKYTLLYSQNAKVIVEEVTINQFENG